MENQFHIKLLRPLPMRGCAEIVVGKKGQQMRMTSSLRPCRRGVLPLDRLTPDLPVELSASCGKIRILTRRG
ncbi:hypothetical protein [Pseudochelatococcus contaminans]|uniref:Uncharacterized protein n=1 Tax=Pseudochelatococcus contaminans TaxID=1538103 RepID=A0A7W5Z3E6_9HYPH|nr:hypothetical protein [Pseudochelatococcus contaminans]MBB3808891.1 hypothetical protein [Pseudochelatococcus contaminans]